MCVHVCVWREGEGVGERKGEKEKLIICCLCILEEK